MVNTKLEFDALGIPTPETRAFVMGEMVRHVAALTQPATFTAVYMHLLEQFAVREEQIGAELNRAFFILVVSGVFLSNDYDEKMQGCSIRAGTTVWPNKLVTDYIWSDPVAEMEDLEDE